MATNEKELRSAIESILLVAGEPVTVKGLAEVFGDDGEAAITAALDEIGKGLDEQGTGYSLELAAGGYRLVTRPEYDSYLKKFFSKQGEGRLSLAALETLAIVAYRQPITAPEVSDIRGVNSSGVVRTLLDRKLVKIAGRKNVVGSPFLYRTTKEFLLHFGLNSVQDLPRLEEFAEILGDTLADELLNPSESAGENETDQAGGGGAMSSTSPGEDPTASEPASGMPDTDTGRDDGVRSSTTSGDVSADRDARATGDAAEARSGTADDEPSTRSANVAEDEVELQRDKED